MSKLELTIPPVLVLILFVVLMWISAMLSYPIDIPPLLRIVSSSALVITGVFCSISGVVSFKHAKTTVNPMTPNASSSLVISGVYRYTRNPMYLGFLLCLVGWGIFLANSYALALTLGFFLYINRFQVQPEESALEAIFGLDWLVYKKRVRRWL